MPKSKSRKNSAKKVAQRYKQTKEQKFAAARKQEELIRKLTADYNKQYRDAINAELKDREERAESSNNALAATAGHALGIMGAAEANPFAVANPITKQTTAVVKKSTAKKTATTKTTVKSATKVATKK